ncbi:hypothetical protein FNV43_RR08961 [Rhamnella rubrinervis]|uniref:Expansin-like CBD domain-containing protein n=1 Tax=Rhamnella rubrinervis TaxID=2594499 RepID=A0A8K0H9W7_9ROSA|nr:hypothetical protein FNV43_RR08961 [Rhamnella rubrinervis]
MEGLSMMAMLQEFLGCTRMELAVVLVISGDGMNVVVTDYGEGDRTDFILSSRAHAKLARPNLTLELFAYGEVDVEYRRISWHYNGYKLMFKVHENSRYPHYLAILLYVGGQNDITSVELRQEDCKEWIPMRRAYGIVWDMANPPVGSISLRLLVSDSAGLTWVQTDNVIPIIGNLSCL